MPGGPSMTFGKKGVGGQATQPSTGAATLGREFVNGARKGMVTEEREESGWSEKKKKGRELETGKRAENGLVKGQGLEQRMQS
ncbi:hypothetical protein VTN49DRAFT_4340 [Thermomyces lanuginosus]|uniref:uncharacterized protein n=1 Tax=Thermomyces lanuginosus TaxID=5541 RepID=UPI00374454DC